MSDRRFAAVAPTFAAIAGVGLALSAIAHVAAMFGRRPLGGASWALHGGALILGLFAAVAASDVASPWARDVWNKGLDGCPRWAKALAGVAFAYAILNFLLFWLRSHGTHPSDDVVIQGFSGHWMFFYSGELALFLARADRQRRTLGLPGDDSA